MTSAKARKRMDITGALRRLSKDPLRVGALNLFNALGYWSDRTVDAGTVDDFLNTYQATEILTKRQLDLIRCWKDVEIVFQVTETEMLNNDTGEEVRQFNAETIKSLLFLAVEMPNSNYSRTHFANTTRAVNRLFSMPVVIVFRHCEWATLGVIHRRLHKQDADLDVLERVALVKDVSCLDPHRGQVDILTDLARLTGDCEVRNFDRLHAELMTTFDIEKLSRRFYCEIFNWFEWAATECSFPNDLAGEGSEERHVIRLITRMMFIWFLKEQRLIPDSVFTENFAAGVLKEYSRDSTTYYQAVLQNLFFATLNTEAEHRSFRRDGIHNNYHYQSHFVDANSIIEAFQKIPFVNGGLFDCLDHLEVRRGQLIHLDMFGDEYAIGAEESLHVPARLFFEDDRGLFSIFRAFKFTVQEGTPLEHEVALDPELLGSVFENLLASYNPETRDHARHATGSYYTPRPIVEYMVKASITLALSTKMGNGNVDSYWFDRLDSLVDETRPVDVDSLLSLDQRILLVEAITDLTILDPAVGSGAFLMSALHTLTSLLQQLDPDGALLSTTPNRKVRLSGSSSRAFDHNPQLVDSLSLDGDDAVRHQDTNYGRKLHLIQNSLFGVDVQPIACQIAKLRFFISLAIEQSQDDAVTNEFRPLPNLETRLVAADTLVREIHQEVLSTPEVDEANRQLLNNRKRYFRATSRDDKSRFREADRRSRSLLGKVLHGTGLSNQGVSRLTEWDPYDPNSSAQWFEPQYMFGRSSFDVVIGNPPYIQLQKDAGRLRQKYEGEEYITFAATGDIYQLFFERGIELLGNGGLLSFIASNSWLKAKYGVSMRRFLGTMHTPMRLVEMGKGVFENTTVDTAILLIQKGRRGAVTCSAVDRDDVVSGQFPPPAHKWGELRTRSGDPWIILSTMERRIMQKMEAVGTPLAEWDNSIYRGILTGFNEAFVVTESTREHLIAEDAASAQLLKPILRGRDIRRYHAQWDKRWLIATIPALRIDIDCYPAIKRHLLSFDRARLEQNGRNLGDGRRSRKKTCHRWYELQDTCAYHAQFEREKLFWMHMSPEARFSYAGPDIYCNAKGYMITGEDLKYLCGILNSCLSTYYIRKIAVTTGMGLIQWNKFVVEQIPVPPPKSSLRGVIEDLVDQRLETSDQRLKTVLEQRIDRHAMHAFGLSKDEMKCVQSGL